VEKYGKAGQTGQCNTAHALGMLDKQDYRHTHTHTHTHSQNMKQLLLRQCRKVKCTRLNITFIRTLAVFWHSEDSASWYILIIKPTRCNNFPNLFFGIELYMFQTGLLSIIRSLVLYTQCSQSAKPVWLIPIAVYTVLDAWRWTEDLSETCRVLFQKINLRN
jgi:hypothetical protein